MIFKAIIASLLLHVLILIVIGRFEHHVPDSLPAKQIIQVNLLAAEIMKKPQPLPQQSAVEAPSAKVTPIEEKRLAVKPKPKPVKKKLKKPRVKTRPPIKPQGIVNKITPQQVKTPVAVASTQPAIKTETITPVSKSVPPSIDHRQLEQNRKNYLAQLLRHIQQHKYYPKSAQRRRIQGEVIVSLEVNAQGQSSNIHVESHSDLLRQAAIISIKRSLPLPLPAVEVKYPVQLHFKMRYHLKSKHRR